MGNKERFEYENKVGVKTDLLSKLLKQKYSNESIHSRKLRHCKKCKVFSGKSDDSAISFEMPRLSVIVVSRHSDSRFKVFLCEEGKKKQHGHLLQFLAFHTFALFSNRFLRLYVCSVFFLTAFARSVNRPLVAHHWLLIAADIVWSFAAWFRTNPAFMCRGQLVRTDPHLRHLPLCLSIALALPLLLTSLINW